MNIKIKNRGFYNRPCGRACLLAEDTVLEVVQMSDLNKEDFLVWVDKNAWDEEVKDYVIIEKPNAIVEKSEKTC